MIMLNQVNEDIHGNELVEDQFHHRRRDHLPHLNQYPVDPEKVRGSAIRLPVVISKSVVSSSLKTSSSLLLLLISKIAQIDY